MRTRQMFLAITASAAALTLGGVMARSADATEWAAIEFSHTGLCLNDPQGNTANGVQLNIWECAPKYNQLFGLVPTSEPGMYLIKLALDPNKCLADPWDSTENGIKLEVYTCSETPAFEWHWSENHFEKDEAFFTKPNGMGFGDKDGIAKNGNPVIMWQYNFKHDQEWTVFPL